MTRVLALCLGVALALACAGPEDPLDEIRALQSRGRFAPTVDPLRKLLDEDPSRTEASFLLGVALLNTGNSGLAVWPLRRAAESPEVAVDAGLLLARALLESRSAPDAVKAADAVLALEPDNANALVLRSQARLATGALEEGLADIERVLELDPDNLAVLVPRVTALISLQRIDEAEAALETARERIEIAQQNVPRDMRARLCLARGSFAFEKGEREAGEAQYAECLEQFPGDPLVVSEAVAFYHRLGQRDRATEILRQAFEETGDAFFRAALARRLGSLGDRDEELRLLRQEAEERPNAASWFAVADTLVRRGRYDEAVEAFEKAVAASRNPSPKLRFAYADTLVQAERYEDARRAVQQITQPELRALIRGRILLGEGDARGALASFEEGLRLWPNNPAARYLAGQAAERLGDYERAASEYRESLRAGPAQTHAGLLLARLYSARGDHEGALEALRRYIEANPRDPEVILEAIHIAHRGRLHNIAAEGLERLRGLPGQEAVAVAEEAGLVAAGPGPARGVEVIERSGLDLSDPENAPALDRMLALLAAQEEHARGAALADAAVAAHPDAAVFHALRGRARAAAGEPTEAARAAFERALELDPASPVALVGLAELEAAAGSTQAAVALYDRAAAAQPGEAAAGLAAARLLIDAGETDAARTRLEELLEQHPREAEAALALADLLADAGDLERALALAERAAWLRAPEAEASLARIRALRGDGEIP